MSDQTEGAKAAEETRKAAEDAKSAAREEASSFREGVEEEVTRRAADTRDMLAGEMDEFGEALRSASGKLRRGSPQEQLMSSAATALEEFSSHVQGRDLGELLEEVNDFGRRNPAAFLGGAALLGFAGMRLVKASQRRRPIEHEGGTPASAGLDPTGGATAPRPPADQTTGTGPSTVPPASSTGGIKP